MSDPLTAPGVIGGRFALKHLAATGGMGNVYRAIDLDGGQEVALKLMSSSASASPERFLREAELLATLDHPHIVRYVAHGQNADGQMYLTMEWLEGEDLRQRLDRGRLSLADTMTLAQAVGDALASAHRRGVVHRDLKPSNLVLPHGDVGRVKLIDFGIARCGAAGTLTRTGALIGTPQYMAPEQARGQRDITAAADVFALGCILYECLSGQPPFASDHPAAVLGKILFDEPAPIASVCPRLPAPLADWIMSMLIKDPALRPTTAAAVVAALSGMLPLGEGDSAPVTVTRQTLTGGEQYLVSVVVARATPYVAATLLPTVDLQSDTELRLRRDLLRRELARFGAQVEALADGSIVVTLARADSATDLALQGARCALLLQARWPDALVALATGRARANEFGHVPLGEALDRAVLLLRGAALSPADSGGIDGVLVDDLSAGLLDARFLLQPGDGRTLLQAERASVDETRLLLGKPTPCLGREHELALLELHLRQCIADSCAHAVLVTAPPGIGKSRLRHELLRRIEKNPPASNGILLFGRGDPTSAGTPYGLLGQALRRLCDVHYGEALEQQRTKLRTRLCRHVAPGEALQMVEFLGEICGVPFAEAGRPLLQAARQDPKVMSEQVTTALVDFFVAECAHNPVLLVLDDLHWGDGISVRLVDAVLQGASDLPFMVLALGRPDLFDRFPGLWPGRHDELPLRGLSAKAAGGLARQVLGDAIDAPTVARVVRLADGNALLLEELLRAIAEGKGERLPETVLAMLQSRLSRIDAETRRVLRAASVFGQTFWRGGVVELCNSAGDHADIAERLEIAVRQELVECNRESRFPSEVQYTFRHALLRDAAYRLLTEADRQLGHHLAGKYLERIGEPDPAVLADHYQQGNDPTAAIPLFVRAAEQALVGNDLRSALQRAERGMQCQPRGEALGSLREIQCFCYFWNNRWETAYPLGIEALALLPVGDYRWCRALGLLIIICGLSGRLSAFDQLVLALAGAEPTRGAHAAFIEATGALLMAASYLASRANAEQALARMEQIGAALGTDDATADARIKHTQVFYWRLLRADPWRTLEVAEQGVAAWRRAGRKHNLIMLDSLRGVVQTELGDATAGEATARAALALAERLELLPLMRARVSLAYVLCELDDATKREEAFALAQQTIEALDNNAVYLGMAHDVLARVHLSRGEYEAAERQARRSAEIVRAIPALRARAVAAWMRALTAQQRAAEARALGAEAIGDADRGGGGGFAEVGLRLALAEACLACGDTVSARAAADEALDKIRARAERIPDEAARRRYLAAPESARAHALALQLEASPR